MGEVVTLVEERDSVGLGAGMREAVPDIELRGMIDEAAIGLRRFDGLATNIRGDGDFLGAERGDEFPHRGFRLGEGRVAR